jgi:hypothetical protein
MLGMLASHEPAWTLPTSASQYARKVLVVSKYLNPVSQWGERSAVQKGCLLGLADDASDPRNRLDKAIFA